MINNPNSFLSMLQKFADKDRERLSKVTKKQMDSVIERINNPDNEFNRMQEISKSAYNLLLWLNAMVKLYEVHKKVEPLEAQVKLMRIKQTKMQAELD